jgi:DNA-binding NarL/FixJ family response regulator
VDALSEVPTLRVVNSNGRFLLTPGEEQVVALVADGLTNRGVATELGLSEHTIKIYLVRISIKWEFRAASNSFSMPWRTAKIARPNGCRATVLSA